MGPVFSEGNARKDRRTGPPGIETSHGEEHIDDVCWLKVRRKDWVGFFFETDPFLVWPGAPRAAKLLYSTQPPYGNSSIRRGGGAYALYHVARRRPAGGDIPTTDREMQAVADAAGFPCASFPHSNLSQVQLREIEALSSSVAFSKRFDEPAAREFATEVSRRFEISPPELHLTGGAQIVRGHIEDFHDIDVVIPIWNSTHAKNILVSARRSSASVVEHGLVWPLRWRTSKGLLVCPFFVCAETSLLPARGLVPLNDKPETFAVTVEDDTLGLLNMPFYVTSGTHEFLALRNRLLRGVITRGDLLIGAGIRALVTEGANAGSEGILLFEPEAQIRNFSEYLERIRA